MRNGQGLKLEKIGPTFSSLNAMPAKITNKFNGQCTLMKFVWYVLHNSAGSFCAGICAFCASIFSGGLIELRWFFLVKTIWRFFCVISFSFFWKFSRLGNLAWDFSGVWFLPRFDHPRHLKSGVPPPPPPPPPTPTSIIWVDFDVRVCTAIPRSGGK